MAKRQTNEPMPAERRRKKRFQIEQPVRYKLLFGRNIGETGVGKTLNISSTGVCFTAGQKLPEGLPIEVSMSWPALLNDICPMKLVLYGCVVRSDEGTACMAVERYEFRTQGSGNLLPRDVLPLDLRLPPVAI